MARKDDVIIEISVDDKNLRGKLKKIIADLSNIQIAGDKGAKGIDAVSKSSAGAVGKVKDVNQELTRLQTVLQDRPKAFVTELSKSIKWLIPAMGKLSSAGGSIDARFGNLVLTINKFSGAAKRMALKTKEVRKETTKARKGFSMSGKSVAKFAGAVGLGIYSMYSLANAARRGLRAVGNFIKDGILLAINKHKEFGRVIKAEVTDKLEALKLKLGEAVLPALAEASVEAGKLLDTLSETGIISAFGTALGDALANASALASTLAEDIGGVIKRLKDLTGEQEKQGKGFVQRQYEKLSDTQLKALAAGGVAAAAVGILPGAAASSLAVREIARRKREETAPVDMGKYSDPLADAYASYRRGEPGPYSEAMYKKYGIPVPKKEKPKKTKAKKAKPRAGEEYLRGQPGYTPDWEMGMGYDVGGVTDVAVALGDETEQGLTEALDKFFEEYDKGLAEAEKANARFADNLAGDINSALEGTDAGEIFARRLGAAVEAALSDAIRLAMAKMGAAKALSNIPIIGPFLGALLGFEAGAVVAPTPGGTPGIVGEGGVPEAVVPLDVDNLTTFIRGVSAGLNLPPAVVQVNVRGTDPWFVRAYESSRDGATNYHSRVH